MRPKRCVNIALFILESMFILSMAACAMEQIDKADSINGEEAQNLETVVPSQIMIDDDSGVQYVYSGTFVDFAEYGSDIVVHNTAVRGIRCMSCCAIP